MVIVSTVVWYLLIGAVLATLLLLWRDPPPRRGKWLFISTMVMWPTVALMVAIILILMSIVLCAEVIFDDRTDL